MLADIAAEAGLSREEAGAVLADQRFAETVRAEQAQWHQLGINSVPSIIFDRKHLVTGAQGVENYTEILRQLVELRADAV